MIDLQTLAFGAWCAARGRYVVKPGHDWDRFSKWWASTGFADPELEQRENAFAQWWEQQVASGQTP